MLYWVSLICCTLVFVAFFPPCIPFCRHLTSRLSVLTILDPRYASPPRKTSPSSGSTRPSPLNDLIAGGIAGAVSRTAVAPLERLKILLQTRSLPTPSSSITHSFLIMLRTDGVMGLFKGNGVNVLRIVPYSATQFACYEGFKRWFAGRKALAGMCSVTVTYPLDFLRTRLAIPSSSPTLFSTATTIIKTEPGGPLALYRGLTPSLVGVAPYMAINLVLYETLRDGVMWDEEWKGWVRLGCGAGCRGGVAQTVTFPVETLRRRVQVVGLEKGRMDGGWEVGGRIWREEGVVGFYRGEDVFFFIDFSLWWYFGGFLGLVPNLIKVVPAAAISFFTYETAKSFLTSYR
ncbi:mitochondrial carrier domain-containing protein [Chytridium lagenaria]|nr:mitochondrial carrier domain-containing protein [Chytridium lagenaria]